MLRRNLTGALTAPVAIPPKRGVAYPRLGVCMVPFYIIYYSSIGSTLGGYGHVP